LNGFRFCIVEDFTVLLPETNKKKLPDTLEEGEAFLRVNNPLTICSSRSTL
jgi:hypothetical protein